MNYLTSFPICQNFIEFFKPRVRNISIIENIATAIIFALVAVLLFIACPAPISSFLGSIFLIAAFSMFIATQVIAFTSRPKPLPIPGGILDVIKQSYPIVFYKLIVEQRLNIQEFKAVINVLKFGKDLNTLPKDLYEKIVSFGERYLYGYTALLDVESLLSKHCPLHWLYRFVEYSNYFREKTSLSVLQAAYSVLGPIAQTAGKISVFNPMTYAIASLITEKEFVSLKIFSRNGAWDNNRPRSIRLRLYREFIASWSSQIQQDLLYISRMVPVFDCSERGFNCFLLLFSLHNLTWEQIKLIRLLSFEEWQWFCSIETESSKECLQMASLGGFLYNLDILDELSVDYQPAFALLLRKEIEEIVKVARKKNPQKSFSEILVETLYTYGFQLFSRKPFSLYESMKQATSRLPSYRFNITTGKRTSSEVNNT
ncbi:DUF1389 domain-containing protein [Chlamydia sp. 17-3921]|uniref:DUF1389 domain-containing protein n=1 Tax=Chlamydia sp. 17-3921 TaxID=2675798 RepID=UPI0019191720|nr:DUF1389 domain-containing protein [Chlamydia sp. 17-3921]